MSTGIDIRMALGSDLIGMILVVIMIIGNIWRLRLKNRESKLLIAMLATCFSCCLSDVLGFMLDGYSGTYGRAIVYFVNTWLFASNSFCAFSWFLFLKEHFKIYLRRSQRRLMLIAMITLMLMLAVNLFFPLVFSVNYKNVYHREFGYWIFLAINYGIIINSLLLYFKNYRQDGMIRFFPIWLYVIPIAGATIAQSLFYGISLMSTSFAVAIAGAFTSLQNEQVFRDHLTGVFNRAFLDYVLSLYTQKGKKASGIMVSLCGFKQINEKLGHEVGDEALRETAEILHSSVGHWGSILRYSGDEFIIMIDSQFDMHISNCIEKLNLNFDRFNRSNAEPYQLIPAIGFKKREAEYEDANSFLNGLSMAVKKAKQEMSLLTN